MNWLHAMYIGAGGVILAAFVFAIKFLKRSLNEQVLHEYNDEVSRQLDELEKEQRSLAEQHRRNIAALKIACNGDNNKCFVLGATKLNAEYREQLAKRTKKINRLHRRD